MNYVAFNSDTDKEVMSDPCPTELAERMEYEGYESHQWYSIQRHSCRGCQEDKPDVQERSDAHGIYTGHYCEDCYDNNYPYRKDRYPTIETHGYGERLNDDY